MTGTRVAAAIAAVLTALLLQATVVGPLTMPAAVSLPALLVTIVALRSGPSTGMTFGFVTGFVADLASDHPAGVLALVWTLLGVAAGLVRRGSTDAWRRTSVVAAVLATLASVAAGVLLTVFGEPGAATLAVQWAPVTLLVQLVLAGLLSPVVTAFLHARALRPRRVAPTASAALARRLAAGTGTASDDVALVHRG
ncbi:rod shape-determining protein MreD [Jatrophihabitans sp. YIM 134969]